MKLHHRVHGERVEVELSGDLDGAGCDCLRHFWALRVAPHRDIRVELGDVDVADGAGLAELTALVRASLAEGSRLTLHAAPQMLAHALYQSGLLRDGRLVLSEPRQEEPYAG